MTEQKTLTFFEAIVEARKGRLIAKIEFNSHLMHFGEGHLRYYDDGTPAYVSEDILDALYYIVWPEREVEE